MSGPRFWREIPQRYRLEGEKCEQCGKIHYPPRLICDACRGRAFKTVFLAFTGKVISFSVVHTPPSRFTYHTPYKVAIIELDDGTRITAQISDVNGIEVKTGMSVRLEFRKIQEMGKAGIIGYGYKAVPV